MPINHLLYRDLYKNARMLVILKMIFDLGGSATVAQLANILGVHHEGVTDNVNRLAERNLVTSPHKRGGWFITKMGMDFLKPPDLSSNPQLTAENPHIIAEIPHLPITTTITTTLIDEKEEIEVVEESLTAEKPHINAENPHLSEIDAEIPPLPDDVWRAFSQIGITHNPRSNQVSRLPGLTYKGVMKVWRNLQDQGKTWPGLLIQILPTLSPRELRGHSDTCHCDDCYAEHQQLLEERHLNPRRRHGEWSDE